MQLIPNEAGFQSPFHAGGLNIHPQKTGFSNLNFIHTVVIINNKREQIPSITKKRLLYMRNLCTTCFGRHGHNPKKNVKKNYCTMSCLNLNYITFYNKKLILSVYVIKITLVLWKKSGSNISESVYINVYTDKLC